MQVQANNFIPASSIAVRDPDLQLAVNQAMTTAYNKRLAAMFVYGNEHGEWMRQQAAEAKRRALRSLPELLEKTEANMTANGIKVLWAEDAAEVCRYVVEIARQHDVKVVTKSKSMISEEVALNHVLEEHGIRVVETDLGEYIVQLSDETPSHIVMPVVHRTKESIRELFKAKLNMPHTDEAEEMTAFARQVLREAFLSADMGVSGGNFVIAETGTVCLVTNEGNGRMVTTLPRVHVAIVGIEKVVETVDDYAMLTQILPRSATGQNLPVYTNMMSGPRREGDPDGPEHQYVIFVDNGRTKIYGTEYTEVLACIRCGACQNACPVYRVTGGHAYGWVYAGPIGAVVTPLLNGLDQAKPLPNASSLCGKCKEVCPVDIDLPRLLLDLRRDLVAEGKSDAVYNWGIKLWEIGNRSPRLFALGGAAARVGQKIVGQRMPGPIGGWTKYRDFPDFAPKSFRQLWRERKNGKS